MARKRLLSAFAENPQRHYAEPPVLPAPPTLKGLERIETHERSANASAVLRTLEHGMERIERDIDALRIEEHLARQPKDPRAPTLRARLAEHRANAPPKAQPAPAPGSVPPIVSSALELLGGARPPRRVDRRKLIAQLEEDRELVREAIYAQQPIVDAIRDELSVDAARRFLKQHQGLVVAQYRAAQAFAAATDALGDFALAFTASGYCWRADLLPAPNMRAALLLGSERDFDSEVRRTGRQLEEANAL